MRIRQGFTAIKGPISTHWWADQAQPLWWSVYFSFLFEYILSDLPHSTILLSICAYTLHSSMNIYTWLHEKISLHEQLIHSYLFIQIHFDMHTHIYLSSQCTYIITLWIDLSLLVLRYNEFAWRCLSCRSDDTDYNKHIRQMYINIRIQSIHLIISFHEFNFRIIRSHHLTFHTSPFWTNKAWIKINSILLWM